MAANKKNYQKPQTDVKAFAQKKENTRKNITRVVALVLAGLMVLSVGVSAVYSLLA